MSLLLSARNDVEHRFYSLNILHRAYACQGIYRPEDLGSGFQSACGDGPSAAFLFGIPGCSDQPREPSRVANGRGAVLIGVGSFTRKHVLAVLGFGE